MQGGLGFDAVWYADFYHHLIGDAQNDSSRARLLKFAGYGDDRAAQHDVVRRRARRQRPTAASSITSPTTRPATPTTGERPATSLGTDHRRRGQRRAADRRDAAATPRRATRFAAGDDAAGARRRRCSSWARRSAPRCPTATTTSSSNREDFQALRAGRRRAAVPLLPDLIRLRLAHPALALAHPARSSTSTTPTACSRSAAGRRAEDMLVVG